MPVSERAFDVAGALRNAAAFSKCALGLEGLISRGCPIEGSEEFSGWSMLPVCELHRRDIRTVQLLSEWRIVNQFAFPTRFNVTLAGTAEWLSSAVLDNPDRILFLVCDPLARPVAHLGLVIDPEGTGLEVDSVVRGVQGHPGLMAAAMLTLERWATRETACEQLTLRVLGSNTHARDFYTHLGYVDIRSQDLAWEQDLMGRHLTLTATEPDDIFITMKKNISDVEAVPDPVPTAGPSVGPQEIAYSVDAARTGWQSHHSDYLRRFEAEFAQYIGVSHAMATSSCTGALHLALLAAGVGSGDEVIVPETTWVATASAVAYVGATPVFADICLDSWGMDPTSVRGLISEHTRAIIPVHLYGYAAPILELRAIADEFGLVMIEDAAPAVGTMVGGAKVGSFGDIGCFSFQGAKMLVTGEGGMLVTDDDQLFAAAQKLNDHGRMSGTFWIERLGRKYKMNNVTAAFGLGQLERVEVQIEHKRRIHEWYREDLGMVRGLHFQEVLPNTRSIHWMNSIRLDSDAGFSARQIAQDLAKFGIDTRPVFPPISRYPIWGRNREEGPVASEVGDNSINLPSGVLLPRSAVRQVSDRITGCLERE